MPRITFYGGARELGGNQFLLEDDGTRVLLDFGLNFDRLGRYYSFPSSPKKFEALDELTDLGIYPGFDGEVDFDGVYRPDYLRRIGRKPSERTVDGVVLSHAHVDHASGLHFLRPDLPVWMDIHTKRLLHSMQQTSSAPFNEFIEFSYTYAETPRIREDGNTWMRGDSVSVAREINLIKPPETFTVGSLAIEPHYVDHSLPGSCGFIVRTSAGPVVYTGDIRLRGRRREDTERFLDAAAASNPSYLLCEGSLIRKRHGGSEDDVVTHIAEFIRDRPGLVIVSYPPRDLDRLLSIYRAGRKTGRKLVIGTRQAYLLELFGGDFGYPKTDYKNMAIFIPRKNTGNYAESDYLKWERKYLGYRNTVRADDLRKNPRDFILTLGPAGVGDFKNIRPPPGSVLVRSHPEPYNEEMVLDEKVLLGWLKKFELVHEEDQKDLFNTWYDFRIPQVHVTGHCSADETAYIINRIKPKVLVPIHTVFPEDYAKMFPGEIRIPERGGVLEL